MLFSNSSFNAFANRHLVDLDQIDKSLIFSYFGNNPIYDIPHLGIKASCRDFVLNIVRCWLALSDYTYHWGEYVIFVEVQSLLEGLSIIFGQFLPDGYSFVEEFLHYKLIKLSLIINYMMISRLARHLLITTPSPFFSTIKVPPPKPKIPTIKAPLTPSIKPKAGELSLAEVAQQLNIK